MTVTDEPIVVLPDGQFVVVGQLVRVAPLRGRFRFKGYDADRDEVTLWGPLTTQGQPTGRERWRHVTADRIGLGR